MLADSQSFYASAENAVRPKNRDHLEIVAGRCGPGFRDSLRILGRQRGEME